MTKNVFLALLTLAACTPLRAQSWLPADSPLSLSGFGTLGAASTNTDDAQFIRYNQARGARSGFTTGTDSNLGLQASYQFTPQLSATLQTLTRKYTSPGYSTDLSWAFLKLALSKELSLRAGRVVVPVFMASETQNIGYANTMIRPPMELYALAPIENVDGLDLVWQHAFGATTLGMQLAGGVSTGKLVVSSAGGNVVDFRAPLLGLRVTLENGPFMLSLGRLRADFGSSDFTALNAVTNQLRAGGYGDVAQRLTIVGGKQIDFTSLGMTMDSHGMVLQAEYGRRRAAEPAYVSNNDAWYAMAGYRIGAFLLYYAHAAVRQTGRSLSLPAALAATPLGRAIDGGFLTSPAQRSDLVGVRWNVAPSRALTVQVDRLRPTVKNGELTEGPPGGPHAPVMVIAVALDAVF